MFVAFLQLFLGAKAAWIEQDERWGSTPAGDLPTSQESFTLPGFDCGNNQLGNGTVMIFFPSALNGTYPIVSMLHGSGGGKFFDLGRNIASLGIVVVAPLRGVCGDWSLQQIHAVEGSMKNPALHRALKRVTLGKPAGFGVIGHSRGGAFSMGTAAQSPFKSGLVVKAMVASHGGSSNAAPRIDADIPCFFAEGSGDPRRHRVFWAYSALKARPRVWAVLAGGRHMEPAHAGRQNRYMAHFLGCYLLPRQESCDMIFGNGTDSLCHRDPNPMSGCTIDLK